MPLFSGPAGVIYDNNVEITTDDQEFTPDGNTAYDMTAKGGKTYVINAAGYDIKLSGDNSTDNKHHNLDSVTANSLWLAGGSFVINAANDVTNAGQLYICGGQAHLQGSFNITNAVTLGTPAVDTGYDALDTSLRIGAWNVDSAVKLTGAVNIVEDTRLGFQGSSSGSTLEISETLSGSGDIAVTTYNCTSNKLIISGNSSGYTGAISLAANSGAAVTMQWKDAAKSLMSSVESVTLGERTTLDLTGLTFVENDNMTDAQATDNANLIKLINKTTGAGTVKLAGGTAIQPRNKDGRIDVNIRTNYVVGDDSSHSLTLTGWGKDGNNWRKWIVGEGGSITVGGGAGELHVKAKQQLAIENGGSISVGTLKLGHQDAGNPGSVVMSGDTSSMIVSQILGHCASGNFNNSVNITGGSLTVTGTNALAVSSGARMDVHIGATGDGSVVLKTVSNDWVLDGSSDNLGGGALSIGNITIHEGNTNSITIANAALSGKIVNSGSIQNNASLILGNGIYVAENGSATITGGNITITSTIDCNGTLNLSGANITLGDDFSAYTIRKEGTISYSEGNGNGFITHTGADLYLLEGAGASVDESLTVSHGGKSYGLDSDNNGVWFTVSGAYTNTEYYYITKGSVDVVGTGGSGTATGAGSYVIQGGTLNLTSGTINTSQIKYDEAKGGGVKLASTDSTLNIDNADGENWLTQATGSGNVAISTTVTLRNGTSPQTTGDIIINSGAELILNRISGDSATEVETASINNVVLNGGLLSYTGGNATINSISSTADTSKLYIWDMYGASGSAQSTFTITSLNLVNNMEIQSGWKSKICIDSVTGSGNLRLALKKHGDKQVVTINASAEYTGKLDLDGGESMTVNLNIAKDATTTVKADNHSTIANLTLAEGSSLFYEANHGKFTYTITNLEVGGSDTTVGLAATNSYWEGILNIDCLTNARKEDGSIVSGDITISGNSRTANRNVANLNGGDFEGVITYKGTTNDGTDRKHAFNITSETAAAKAVINLEADTGNVVALGIAHSTVQVKGLTGSAGTIYSGKQESGSRDGFSSDDTVRKLVINTAENSYNTSATLGKNLNIEKSGQGKQTFSGDVSSFNGSISALAGELAFTASDALSVSSLNVSNVGTLTVEKNAAKGTISTSDATLAGGATVNANLTLNAGATLQMNGVTQDSAVALDGELTLEKSGDSLITLTGTVLDTLEGLQAPSSGEVVLFTGVDSLVLGGQTYSVGPETLNTGSNVKLSDYFRNDREIDFNKYYLAFNASTGDLTAGLIIPEPTTATLSLLALAGLCARRRRK